MHRHGSSITFNIQWHLGLYQSSNSTVLTALAPVFVCALPFPLHRHIVAKVFRSAHTCRSRVGSRRQHSPNAKGSYCLASVASQRLRMECTRSTSCRKCSKGTLKFSRANQPDHTSERQFLTSGSLCFDTFSDWLRGSVLQYLLACCTLHCWTEPRFS